MGLLGFYLVIYGIPALIASIPGLAVLGRKRWWLGWLLVAGAVVVTIPVAIIADRLHTRALTQAGHIADDWVSFVVRPFIYGVLYFFAASVVWGFVPAKRSKEASPSSKVQPWVEEMRNGLTKREPPS